MPSPLTELTELATALGTLPFDSAAEAAAARPAALVGLDGTGWERLAAAVDRRADAATVHAAFNNGRALLRAEDGLRGRAPRLVEWKGPQRAPGYEMLPADLRIDHVYLVSCKYMSKILLNVAPSHLFDRALAVRAGARPDWYEEVAAGAYDAFYAEVRRHVDLRLPMARRDLGPADRAVLKASARRHWPAGVAGAYADFSRQVAEASAARWRRTLATAAQREQMLWRLLRLHDAPYFVLGTAMGSSLRLRIGTPWDWRRHYRLRSFEVAAVPAGQPQVSFAAGVEGPEGPEEVRGHVEIRWSHGRFCGFPEAKVYLDTPHDRVPGYFPLR